MPKHPLRAWRDHQPEIITQGQLAAQLGVSQSMIADIERGSRSASLELACELEKITDLHPREFIRPARRPKPAQPG